ncbi:MAG: MBL fold metallo-hydrolase [Bacillota bacterium]|nr:MBL fold metallo-hydrolase [Bacillota bacterium]
MKVEHFLCGAVGTNCYLAYSEESRKGFIVDPGGSNRQLLDRVKAENIEVEAILLTHGHGDHIGGLDACREAFPKALLVACAGEREMLEDSRKNFSREICGRDLSYEADRYVEDGDTMETGGMKLQFLATPGHTPGGMCILAGDVLFSGDTLFAQSVGRTDFPGSSWEELLSSIREKLFLLPDDTQVLPGHMGPTTIGTEKRHNPFV